MSSSRLLKKPHKLRCAQSPLVNRVVMQVRSADFTVTFHEQLGARLASEVFLSSLHGTFFSTLLGEGGR